MTVVLSNLSSFRLGLLQNLSVIILCEIFSSCLSHFETISFKLWLFYYKCSVFCAHPSFRQLLIKCLLCRSVSNCLASLLVCLPPIFQYCFTNSFFPINFSLLYDLNFLTAPPSFQQCQALDDQFVC